ncbi:MAG: hypothetical protein WAM30_20075 [Candidatus Dormiibacterota bacterium]
MLTAEQLQHFRERLESDRASIQAQIEGGRRDLQRTVRDEEGAGDTGDEASLLFEREQDIDDSDDDRRTLALIDRALRRLEAGTYGLSEVSGEPIPLERLEAVPYATTLVGEELPGRSS